MRVAIAGGSGLIGTELIARLRDRGDEVVQLVRSEPEGEDQRRWWPTERRLDGPGLDDVDAAVCLSGASIAGGRWSDKRRRTLIESRVDTTHTIAEAVGRSARCRVLLSGSAVGFYGSRGEDVITEASAPGEGFLPEVAQRWENAADVATPTHPTRTVLLRTGLVLTPDGGLLAPLKLLFGLGLGGRVGDGRQFMPWITLHDHVRACLHLLDHEDVSGPVNLVGPQPARNSEFTRALGVALGRPTVLPTPLLPAKLALGEQMVQELLLVSCRAEPTVLTGSGFEFDNPHLVAALKDLVTRR